MIFTENLIVSINCVAPIFIYLFIGYYSKKRKFVPNEVYPQLNLLSFHILLPMICFHNIYCADYSKPLPLKITVFCIMGILLVFVLSYFLIPLCTSNPRLKGAYLQNSYRSNIGIISIALAELLMDADGLVTATIIIAILIPIYNILAVLSFEIYEGTSVNWKKILINICKNPIIIGTVLGMVFVFLPFRLPKTVVDSIGVLGKTGSTTALITLGAKFEFSNMHNNRRKVFWGVLTRMHIIPDALMLIAILFGFRGSDLACVLLVFAAPLATSGYTMAQIYNADYETTGQIVIVSSFLCCFTFFVRIFLLKTLQLI